MDDLDTVDVLIIEMLVSIKGDRVLTLVQQSGGSMMLDYRGIGLTSVELLTFLIKLEEAFSIELSEVDFDLRRFQCLEDVITWVSISRARKSI